MHSFKPVIILNVLLVAISLIGIFSVNNVNYTVNVFMELICVIVSVLYLIKGYKKDAAKYYKMYMIFSAAAFIVEYIPGLFKDIVLVSSFFDKLVVILDMVVYGNILIIAFAKDLGRNVSYGICIFNASVYLMFLIVGVANCGNFAKDTVFPIITLYLVYFVNSLIGFTMTVAKYTDKANRNTK